MRDIDLSFKIKQVFKLGYSEREIQNILKVNDVAWFDIKEKYNLHTFFETATHEKALQKILDYEDTRIPVDELNTYFHQKFRNGELSFDQVMRLVNQHHPEFNLQLQLEKEKNSLTKKELEIKEMIAKHSMRAIDEQNKPIEVLFKEVDLDLGDNLIETSEKS